MPWRATIVVTMRHNNNKHSFICSTLVWLWKVNMMKALTKRNGDHQALHVWYDPMSIATFFLTHLSHTTQSLSVIYLFNLNNWIILRHKVTNKLFFFKMWVVMVNLLIIFCQRKICWCVNSMFFYLSIIIGNY